MPELLICKASKRDGSACKSPPALIDEVTGYCRSHDPDLAAQRERDAKLGGVRKAKNAARRKAELGIDPNALPPLRTPHDAETWLERISLSVAVGGMPHTQARVAVAGIQQWLKAYEVGRQADQIVKLKAQIAELKANG